ncbi:ArnT family glycosyltransferase [Hymenobacter sp. CRA2]|uniref:ArnT family glycosyltransferase n=1 Tax=Hymenobacter sp. CRA2 TaxID=1955620 RepID=UPI00098FAFE1|nr:glycosyltransferase family 39 protein [Hymenobacter sp. CRA2]OON70804.1 hypothetical protein B0919_01980 [Hymenobacter sp. CRA2]
MHPLLSLYAGWPTRRKVLVALLALAPVLYFSLLDRMASHPVVMWDESRLACNAAEMLRNGNWLVTYFADRVDLWNTKPPLLIWIQAILFKIIGPGEVALRLPSVLAAAGTAWLLVWFCNRVLNAPLMGLCAALVLLTTSGYIDRHVSRTGDYDTLLVLLTTWYTLSFFRYLEDGRRSALWQAALGVALAVLTKGVAGAMCLPGLLLYAIATGKLLWLMKRGQAYAALGTTVAIVAAYYVAREYAAPGYWHAVYENELGGRLLSDLTYTGEQPWNWYLNMLVNDELLPWLYWMPIGLVALLYKGVPGVYRRFALLTVLFLVCFMVVISSATTKYYWYEAPIYPFCALLAGAGVALVGEALVLRLGSERMPWALGVFLVAVLIGPFLFVLTETQQYYDARHSDPDLLFGRYLDRQAQDFGQLDKYALLSGIDYNAAMEFHKSAAMLKYDHQVTTYYPWQVKEFQPGDAVVVCNPAMRAKLDSVYLTEPLYEDAPCSTVLIKTAR